MPPRSTSDNTAASLTELRRTSAKVLRVEGELGEWREYQRDLIAALHGLVPVAEIAAAAGITRQHVHRLLREQQKEVGK